MHESRLMASAGCMMDLTTKAEAATTCIVVDDSVYCCVDGDGFGICSRGGGGVRRLLFAAVEAACIVVYAAEA